MIEYKLIKELMDDPSQTQRGLAERLSVSLGKLNYVLSGLVEKGYVKAKKFKDNPKRIRYVLTPEGLGHRVKITNEYLKKRLNDFEEIKKDIKELEKEVISLKGDVDSIKID